ncbi:MAG: AMP-binding protein [Blastocatellia bacterium]
MNIVEILREQSIGRPDAAAIMTATKGIARSITFGELDEASSRIAARLRSEGLTRGDALLVFYPMSIELYIVLLAIFRSGMTAMFLDPSAGREHIDQCCALHPPKGLIASPKAHLLRFVSPGLRRIPHKFVIGPTIPGARSLRELRISREDAKTRMGTRDADAEIAPAEDSTPALLTFTSGSTGRPKAALRTHGFLLAQHRVLRHSLGLTAGEQDLTTLPIFVLANLASGVASLIPDADLRAVGAIDPAPVVAQILRDRPVSTAASPAFLERLADHCLAQAQHLPSLRKVFTGGAPVFPRLLDKLHAIAPTAEIVAVYGSTEAEPIAEIPRSAIAEEDHAAMRNGGGLLTGKPVPEIEARVLRDRWGTPIAPCSREEFARQWMETGAAGEIVVAGDHVLPGYLHGHGDEETKFRVAGRLWHRTGDAGYFDSAGRLWLLGRCAARVADDRGTLYPFAVECAAHYFEGLRRTAFLASDGRRLLIVERRDGSTALDLEPLKGALAWAQLDDVRVVKAIPVDKRHNAKIDYPRLRKLVKAIR